MTDEQLLKLKPQIDKAVKEFSGNINHLETAIGLIFISEHFGWRPMLLVHDARTIKRCEDILREGAKDFSFRDPALFPEVGKYAKKSIAWRIVEKGKDFWRAVRGQERGVRQPTVV